MLGFRGTAMDETLAGACPDLAQFNDRIADSYLIRLSRSDIVARVRVGIVERLSNGECTRATIARELGYSQGALQRKLAERGTSFHHLFDEVQTGDQASCPVQHAPG